MDLNRTELPSFKFKLYQVSFEKIISTISKFWKYELIVILCIFSECSFFMCNAWWVTLQFNYPPNKLKFVKCFPLRIIFFDMGTCFLNDYIFLSFHFVKSIFLGYFWYTIGLIIFFLLICLCRVETKFCFRD